MWLCRIEDKWPIVTYSLYISHNVFKKWVRQTTLSSCSFSYSVTLIITSTTPSPWCFAYICTYVIVSVLYKLCSKHSHCILSALYSVVVFNVNLYNTTISTSFSFQSSHIHVKSCPVCELVFLWITWWFFTVIFIWRSHMTSVIKGTQNHSRTRWKNNCKV